MADRQSEPRPNDEYARSLVDLAREHPENAATLGQAFVTAGVQLLVDDLGEILTAAWLAKLAMLLDRIAKDDAVDVRRRAPSAANRSIN